jgi:hypothetical protein
VPLLGFLIGGIWTLVVLAIALSRVHRSHPVQASLAVVVPTLGAVVLAFGLRVWVEAFKVPSDAMFPSLVAMDHVFVTKSSFTPQRGDVVVFAYPGDTSIHETARPALFCFGCAMVFAVNDVGANVLPNAIRGTLELCPKNDSPGPAQSSSCGQPIDASRRRASAKSTLKTPFRRALLAV